VALLERSSRDAIQFARRVVAELCNQSEKKEEYGKMPQRGKKNAKAVGKQMTGGEGFLFLCDNITERECLEKKLFGLPAKEFEAMSRSICPTTKIFLYNTQVL
jgi:hypothetical protein